MGKTRKLNGQWQELREQNATTSFLLLHTDPSLRCPQERGTFQRKRPSLTHPCLRHWRRQGRRVRWEDCRDTSLPHHTQPFHLRLLQRGERALQGLEGKGPASGFTGVIAITLCTAHKDSSKSAPTALIKRSLETQGQRPGLSQCVSRSRFVSATQTFSLQKLSPWDQ